jgi:hypothetical protein
MRKGPKCKLPFTDNTEIDCCLEFAIQEQRPRLRARA